MKHQFIGGLSVEHPVLVIRNPVLTWISCTLIFFLAGICISPGHSAESGITLSNKGTIQVTTFEDELNSDNDCSLREAIQAANFDMPVDACPAGRDIYIVDTGCG
jgi:CSLREA domain-containing protein